MSPVNKKIPLFTGKPYHESFGMSGNSRIPFMICYTIHLLDMMSFNYSMGCKLVHIYYIFSSIFGWSIKVSADWDSIKYPCVFRKSIAECGCPVKDNYSRWTVHFPNNASAAEDGKDRARYYELNPYTIQSEFCIDAEALMPPVTCYLFYYPWSTAIYWSPKFKRVWIGYD